MELLMILLSRCTCSPFAHPFQKAGGQFLRNAPPFRRPW